MGLGPPVCEKCHLMAWPLPEDDPRYGSKVSYGRTAYFCKQCDSVDIKNNLWEYDLEDQVLISAKDGDV